MKKLTREECLDKASRARSTTLAAWWELRAEGYGAGEALEIVRTGGDVTTVPETAT